MTEQDLVIQELRAENAKLKERLEEQSKPTEPTDMDKLTTEMMEHICDNICMHPIRVGQTQDELDDICAECKMGKFVCNILNTYNRLNEFDKTQSHDLLKKLSKYRNLEEQGLLLKLPCKVGDIVYHENKYATIHTGIQSYQITNIMISQNKKGEWTKKYRAMFLLNGKIVDSQLNFSFDEIGKTVFLTEQKAQAALEKMKAGGVNG